MNINESLLLSIYRLSNKNPFLLKVFRRLSKALINFYFKITNFFTFKSLRHTNNSNRKRVHIHTQAWGEYLDWFFKYNLPSLLQEGNIPKLALNDYEIHLFLYTSIKDKDRLFKDSDLMSKLKNFSEYGEYHIKTFRKSDFIERNFIQMKNLLHFIMQCLKKDAYFIHSPPDIIFGNNSIFNALRTIENKNVCFSAPTARVSLSKIENHKELKNIDASKNNLSNARLVNCLFECSHDCIEFAFDNLNSNTTFATGISIRKLNSNSFAVIHNIPSVFLGKFKAVDLLFYHIYNSFNEWDRKWQSLLLRENRLKICGSSELFFLLELTKDSDKIPTRKEGMLNNDLKNEGLTLEHLIPNQFISFWQSENKI